MNRGQVMTDKVTWDDYEELGALLFEKHPDVEPLGVRFTDLRQWVMELDQFEDVTGTSTEGKLEAIQMAWLEYWQDEQE